MQYFTLEEIIELHFMIINDYGGSHGVRSDDRIASLVEASAQQIFGEDVYKTAYEKAAVYVRNCIGDHPFADGNKRTGITLAAIFLSRHGYELTAKPHELENFAVKIATDRLSIEEIAEWLRDNSAS